MTIKNCFPNVRRSTVFAALVSLIGLSACTASKGPGQINDPYEAANRKSHAFNVALDSDLVRPAAKVYGHVLPKPVRQGVSNFASNLSLPSYVLNDLLQAKVAAAGQNTLRFAFNTIFGIGGLFDPAGALGVHAANNDFGETLYVWGVREGAYLDVPFFGPSTERDFAGTVVDVFADPVRLALPKDLRNYPLAIDVASHLDYRYRYNDIINSILHDSVDSYAQTRLIYLEKRHHDLGESSSSTAFDPYEDPYAN